ncbi:hypothetical protein [Arthrobacter sp. Bz4]|uniref:hypothetical protein n=1 Tax=Arthrobacter sp. Bz4 TaxID=2171979 RepID=UPI0010570482|nr:hypothetical protein [Arthrobacter sp. Bz4]
MRSFVPLTGVLLLIGALGGCHETSNIACPSWAISDDPQDHFEAATLVVVSSIVERDGETAIYGVEAHTYRVSIEKVRKGDLADQAIRVTAMPDPCTGEAVYPDGDPFETMDRVIIFASEQEGEWFTLTPFGGVISFPEGTESPLAFQPIPTQARSR